MIIEKPSKVSNTSLQPNATSATGARAVQVHFCNEFIKEMCLFVFRALLRLHKALPAEMRLIGDNYVRDEFKRHRDASPDEAVKFIREWAVSF